MVKKNILICDNCLSRNYHINISKRNNRLKLKKYCPQCKNHILHEESR
ncbi:MAG: 50S ribosomal protein L33 [Columbia Basin potato purple top phytoplasma]